MPVDHTPTEPVDTTDAEQNHTLTPAGVPEPIRVRVGRFGELDTHELVQLLDSIDSERERARFRESLYISIFLWIAVAWFIFYGPRVLWHQPRLISPADVMRDRELTTLNAPVLPHFAPPPGRPAPKPTIDNKTMEHLRENARPAPAPPLPETPQPAPPAATQPPPPPNPTPQPHTPPPVVADAPTVQQPTKPNFGGPTSAGNAMRDAISGAARDHGGAGRLGPLSSRSSPLGMGGVEVLSDTQGVDFNPYLRRIYSDIYRNWLPLIPPEVQPPLSKEGQTFIRFTILPDGSIGEMHLDGSTHDEAINKSCWGSITTEGQFPPLPSQFHGPNLELRIHYIVSQKPIE